MRLYDLFTRLGFLPLALFALTALQQSEFHAQAVARTGGFHVNLAPDTAFRLFGPVVEAKWAEGWAPHIVYPEGATLEEGMVFTVTHPGHSDTVWTLSHLDLARRELSYVMVTPGVRAGRIEIRCSPEDKGTRVEVTYHFVGLSEEGNHFVQEFTAEHYAREMQSWEKAIDYHVRTGETMRHHPHE